MPAAEIMYTIDSGEKLVNETFGPNNIRRRTSGADDRRQVEINDGRAQTFSLERNGFVLVPHHTAMTNFFNPEEIRATYYGRARFTPHTSFEDPSTPPGAPPRQSIEARALAFF